MAFLGENRGAPFSIDSDRTDSEELIQGNIFQHDNLDEVNGHDPSLPTKLSSLTSIMQRTESLPGDGSGTDTDEDGKLIKAKAHVAQQHLPAERKPAPKKRPSGKTKPSGAINLKDLLDAEILTAGENVLSVEYKGSMSYATLSPEGHIICSIKGEEHRFESPSAFSIALKRLVNPSRKADDGWKTVKYNGRFLDTYKFELAQRRLTGNLHHSSKRSKLAGQSDVSSRTLEQQQADMSAQGGGSNLEDEAKMVPCERYTGEPCSTSGAQPCRVVVTPGAELLMDFHSHLSYNEVIGLLAGSWDSQERVLRVERAFPVQDVESSNTMPTVQMVEADAKMVRRRMARSHGLSCIGWYHSHPHCGTNPSTMDISAQISQARQLEPRESNMPYIGAVVSLSQAAATQSQASIDYFNVQQPETKADRPEAEPSTEGCTPMALEVERESGPGTEAYLASMPHYDMRWVAHRCANSSRRVDLQSPWNSSTRLDKLKASVKSRLPEAWALKRKEEYTAKVEAILSAAWSIFGQGEPAEQGKAEEEDLDISDVSADNRADGA